MYYFTNFFLNYIKLNKIYVDEATLQTIIFSFYDFILIYTIVVFFGLTKIESDIKDEKYEIEAEERALMMQQALENKALARKGWW